MPLHEQLPETTTLALRADGPFLHVTLNRPECRNAMSLAMVRELMAVFEAVRADEGCRAIVLRGAGGHFCAGGDIKDMAGARAAAQQSDGDPYYDLNREFGRALQQAEQMPQVIIAVTEGAVLGGGFGLCCISDVALTHAEAQFGLPETSLGLPPAQIAPFVVKRIGLTRARRLALTGARFDGRAACELGIVHEVAEDTEALDALVDATLAQIRRCAPQANAVTKQLMLNVGKVPLEELLDGAAHSFSEAVRGAEGTEGTLAFVQKRKASWAVTESDA